jgi:CheY-like chemotaxis protein
MTIIRPLSGFRIFLAEDEPFVALDWIDILEGAGAEVVGPAQTVEAAKTLLSKDRIDGAILDVLLGEDETAPVAELLASRDIPFLFCTGYPLSYPMFSRWPGVRLLGKPCVPEELTAALREIILAKPIPPEVDLGSKGRVLRQ